YRQNFGADGLLIVAARPAQADGPEVPVVSRPDAEHELVGAVVAEVLAVFGRRADREAAGAELGVAVRILRRIRVVRIDLLVEAPGVAAAERELDAVEVVAEE